MLLTLRPVVTPRQFATGINRIVTLYGILPPTAQTLPRWRAWRAWRHLTLPTGTKPELNLRSDAARHQECSMTCRTPMRFLASNPLYGRWHIMAPGSASCHSLLWVCAGQLWFKFCRAHQRNVRCNVQCPSVSIEDYAAMCGGLGQPSCTSTSTHEGRLVRCC